MTYKEYCLAKTAKKHIPSDYAIIKDRLDKNNPTITKALSTPTAGEFGWGVLGAGLGAGGAYLLSKKLRRNATKRQRALDILVGALAGVAGSQLILSGTTDESGLSTRQKLRADAFLDSIGKGDRDHSTGADIEEPLDLNWNTIGGTAAGIFSGGTLGAMFGNLDTAMANRATSKQLALAKAHAAKAKMSRADTANYINRYMNQGRGYGAVERARKMGKGFNILTGGAIGGGLGFGAGVLGNMYAAKKHEAEYGGIF